MNAPFPARTYMLYLVRVDDNHNNNDDARFSWNLTISPFYVSISQTMRQKQNQTANIMQMQQRGYIKIRRNNVHILLLQEEKAQQPNFD